MLYSPYPGEFSFKIILAFRGTALMFTAGHQIGDYIIIDNSPLDQGSGTLIYRVRHKDDPNSIYVLKILRQGLSQTERKKIIAQLRRDYRVATQLQHSNIIKAVTGVLTEPGSGSLYIVLEFFDGKPINTAISHGNTKDLVAAFFQCADALAYTHSKKIYHGDITPRNILVKRDSNGTIEAKLIDFGLARIAGHLRIPALDSTMADAGTVVYAAPERLIKAEAATASSDIYSLGMVLYEILAQRLPFEIKPGQNVFAAAVSYHTSRKTPAPPATHISAPTDAARGLSYIALRAISRRPFFRYWSMKALKDDLIRADRNEIPSANLWLQQYQSIWVNIISAPISIAIANTLLRTNLHTEAANRGLLLLFVAAALWAAAFGVYTFIKTTARDGLVLTGLSLLIAIGLVIGQPLFAAQEEVASRPPQTNQPAGGIGPAQGATTEAPVSPEPTFTPSAEPTATITPIPPTATNTEVPPTPSNTRTPRPTNTPAPTRTPRPTPTPMPGLGAAQGNEELSVVINELDWYSEQDQYTPALWFQLTLTNNTDVPMEINFDTTTIRGTDSQGADLAEFYNEAIQQQQESSNWCSILSGAVAAPYEATFVIPPRQSVNRDINLTLDRNGYSHRHSGGCDLQYKFGFDVVYVEVSVPTIRYRTTTPAAIEVKNLKWKLDKPLPQ